MPTTRPARVSRVPVTPALPTLPRARLARLALAAQGLHREYTFGRGIRGVQRAIEHLGYVQIDTISVVARAHHHTLFTRVPDYQPDMLDRLQARRQIFEYWYHAAAYLPMCDYRFALPRMLAIRTGARHWFTARDRKLEAQVLERIRNEGALRTRDLDNDETSPGAASGWWNWKPAKRAIEALFMEGTLMCAGRDGFAKVYDLPERVLPPDIDVTPPDDAEYAAYLVRTHLRANGFAAEKEFSYLRRGAPIRAAIRAHLDEGVANATMQRMRVAETQAEVYVLTETLQHRPKVAPQVRLLSPFDNAIIQRDRTVRVHDFDYQIECYVKATKRQFGYFCLPILYGERLIGRADCKAERKMGVLRVVHLHIERSDVDATEFAAQLLPALKAFATFNGCQELSIDQVSPRSYRAVLKQLR